MLLLLREIRDNATVTGMEECKLIVSILAMVVHKVPTDDLVSV
jgi:nuclear pore complex protein Nup205